MRYLSFDCGLKSLACVDLVLDDIKCTDCYIDSCDARILGTYLGDVRKGTMLGVFNELVNFTSQRIQTIANVDDYMIIIESQFKNNTKMIQHGIICTCLSLGIPKNKIIIANPSGKLKLRFTDDVVIKSPAKNIENPSKKQQKNQAKYKQYKKNKQAAIIQFNAFAQKFQPDIKIDKGVSDISDAFLQCVYIHYQKLHPEHTPSFYHNQ